MTSSERSKSSTIRTRFSSFTKVLDQTSGTQTSFAQSESVSTYLPIQPVGSLGILSVSPLTRSSAMQCMCFSNGRGIRPTLRRVASIALAMNQSIHPSQPDQLSALRISIYIILGRKRSKPPLFSERVHVEGAQGVSNRNAYASRRLPGQSERRGEVRAHGRKLNPEEERRSRRLTAERAGLGTPREVVGGFVRACTEFGVSLTLLEYVVYRSHLRLRLYLFISPPITCLK